MKKKKDVLFLCQFFYPEYVSSATLPFDTAVALKNAGYSVDALCGYPHEYSLKENLPRKDNQDGIDIHRVSYIQLNRSKPISRVINYFSFTFKMFLHIFEMAKYEVIIVYSNPPILPWIASWAKKLFKSKLVFVAYDLYPEIAVKTHSLKDGNIICKLMNHINKKVFACADRVVVLSNEMKEYVENHRQIEKSKVVVIPNWYKDEEPGSASTEDNVFYAKFADRFVVSFMGNLGICQDLDTILDAIRLLRDDSSVQFLFSGHGNKMEALKEAVQEENFTNVSVYPFLNGKDYADALQISDCALISLYEGITGLCVPSRTYSYMMQGLPLIVIMDESDIANDTIAGAGIQVRNGDAQGLVSAINDMKNNPLEHEKMRRKSREIYLKKYTMEIATDQYVMQMKSLLNTKKMNICFIVPVPPPNGGIANWTRLVSNYISEKRDDIALTILNTAPKLRATEGRTLWNRVLEGGFSLMKKRIELARVIKCNRPDVIHITTSGQLAIFRDIALLKLAKKKHIPTVYHLRFGRISQIAENNTAEWKRISKAIKLASEVMTIDNETHRAIQKYIPNTKVVCVPNPIDVSKLPQPIDENSRVVMFLGWLVKEKGIEELLIAWEQVYAKHSDWTLRLVGPCLPQYLAYLKEKYSFAGVIYEGEKDHDEAMNLLNFSEIFILPSYTEGFPNVILEAMTLSKPIIATRVAAIPDMLENECGVLINKEDSSDIVNALVELIAHKDRRTLLGNNAKRKLEVKYIIEIVFEEYMCDWKQLAERGE